MSHDKLALHFDFSAASSSSEPDMRTFKVYQLPSDSPSSSPSIELYRFYHPVTGLTTGMTTFHRQNLQTHVFETAGQIEWLSNSNAMIHFGLDQVHIRELRKPKKSSSKSRRFKAGGAEYKWKIAENGTGLVCIDSKHKKIATWIQEEQNLHVASNSKILDILDRVVVTCFLNLWVRRLGQW